MTTKGGAGSIAYSPDSSQLVSGSDDRVVSVWEVESGLVVRKLHGHDDWVSCVSFSPDGLFIASGSVDHTVWVWSGDTGSPVRRLVGHTDRVWSVSFSSMNQVISGSDDRTIRMWNIADGSYTIFEGHHKTVRCVRFAPQDKYIASASDDHRVGIWDPNEKGGRPRWLRGHSDCVYSVAFLESGRRLASCSGDKTVRVWDIENETALWVLKGHVDRVWTVTASGNGWIATGSDDRTIRLWDLNRKGASKTLIGHSHWVNRVFYSPDGKHLASAAQDGTIRIWDGDASAAILSDKAAPLTHYCSALSPTGTFAASAYSDYKVRITNLGSGKVVKSFKLPASPFSMCFSANEKYLLCVVGGLDMGIWEISSGKKQWFYPTDDFIKLAQFTEDGTSILRDTWFTGEHTVEIPTSLHGLQQLPNTFKPDSTSYKYEFEDGWVYAIKGGNKRRIVWIPGRYRHPDARYCIGKRLWLGQGSCTLDLTEWFYHQAIPSP